MERLSYLLPNQLRICRSRLRRLNQKGYRKQLTVAGKTKNK